MKRNLRFVPYKIQTRDFRKWAKRWRGVAVPKSDQDDYVNLFITRDLTTEEVQGIFDAGWDACEDRQVMGGSGCGE